MKRSVVTIAIVLSCALKAFAADAEVAVASASLGEPEALARFLNGQGEWRGTGGQFARLEMRFAQPVLVSKIHVTSCGAAFADGVDAQINFDHTRVFVEGGQPKLTFAIAADQNPIPVQSLVFNFRHNTDVCVRELAIFNGAKPVALRAPKLRALEGSVPTALFDSRLETSWSSSEMGPVEIRFATEADIRRVRVWNGDPRGVQIYQGSPRAKTVALASDSARETFALKDESGLQTVQLKTPMKTKLLRVAVTEAYGGEISQARMAEMQFGDESSFFSPDVSAGLKATVDARLSGFRAAGLSDMVDRTLSFREDEREWSVRLRSDGSIFIRGHSENLERARLFSFVGRYVVVEANEKRVRIKVDGSRFASHLELDGAVCAAACAGGRGPDGERVQDEMSFGRAKDGFVFVRDEGPRGTSGLDFHDFKARVLTSSE
ncbi:MAG: hypothetical protein NDI61_05330 [Bdellovibrionaceae bacterium]|nr:hypothetical protein [Pseudobdellovibrionaceae bacterium]